MRSGVLLALLLALLLPLYSASPEGSIPTDPQLCTGKLSNGFTYYIRRNPIPEGKVELRLVVNVGSILEQEDEQGLSHFLEHMAFNGSPRFPRSELIKRLESVGVRLGKELNAYTTFDETVYSLPISANQLELGLAVIEDWAMNLSLNDESIEKERGVILEELRLGKGASVRIREQYLPVLFGGSLYPCRLPIGKAEVLSSFPNDRLRRYYKKWYRPDLMAIVAVGDLDTLAMKRRLVELFGKYPSSSSDVPPRLVSHVPDHQDLRVVLATDAENSSSSVELSYKHSPKRVVTLRDYWQREVLDELFYSMINARLSEQCQADNPPFSDAESGYTNYFRGVDTYSCYARCKQEEVLRALTALVEENERVRRYGFSESELQRAKAKLGSRYKRLYNEREKFSSDRYADHYQVAFLTNQAIPSVAYEYSLIDKWLPQVTTRQVHALIGGYMSESNRTIVVTGPSGEGIVYPTEQQLRAVVLEASSKKVKRYDEGRVVKQLMRKTPRPGTILSERFEAETGVTEWKLSNGATVAFKPTDFKNNEVLFRSTSNGGFSMYGASDDMSALYATKIQDASGVAGINNTQLRRLMTGKNLSLTQSLVYYNESMSGRFESDDAEPFFQLLYLYHTKPYFDPKSFDRVMAQERADYAKLLDNPLNYFNYEIDRVMSNGNERRKRWPIKENLDQVRFDRARAIYQDRFGNAAGFTYLFVGNIDLEKIKPFVLSYIASIPGDSVRKQGVGDQRFSFPEGPREYEYRKGIDQRINVSLRFAKPIVWSKELDFNYAAFTDILNTRLFESLRREMSGVYGVRLYGSLQPESGGEAQLSLSFGTNEESYRVLIDRAVKEVDRLIADGPTAEELATLKQKRSVALETELRENAFWLNEMRRSYRYGSSLSSADQRRGMIESLSADAIKSAGAQCVDTRRVLRFVLFPEGK